VRLARALLLASLCGTVSLAAEQPPVPEAAPGAPQLTAPPDGAHLPDLGTNLAWTNPPGTTQYHLEVVPFNADGPGIAMVRNLEDSFIIAPPRMGEGNYVLLPDMGYTWRIRASDKSSFAPPGDPSYGPASQRTFRTPAVSSAGITAVEPVNGGPVNSRTPALRWENSDSRVFYYEIQLTKSASFDTAEGAAPVYWELVHGGLVSPLNSYQVRPAFPLEAGVRYYWRVRPRVQGDGQPVVWSRTFSFQTPAEEVRVGLSRPFPNLTFQRLTNLVQPDDGSGRFFATEQRGVIRTISGDGRAEAFLDIQSRVRTDHTEEGLLGLAFDPDFRANGHLYLYYSASGPTRNVLSRYSLRSGDPSRGDPASEEVILELSKPFGNHNGGQLMFGPDGYLYLGPGDGGGGGDPFRNSQSLRSMLGKIHRIDVRGIPGGYRIPPDNPCVDVPGARGEIWAYGLRNPWRFSFDRATGRLWAGDVGQNAWEEIDVIEKGKNYGWNLMEGTHCFSPPSGCNSTGLEMPVAEYGRDDGCSVTGGYVYRGKAIPALAGAYLYADFCSGRVWALWHDGAAITRQQQLLDTGLQITSFAEDLAGEVYLLSWNQGIFRLVPE